MMIESWSGSGTKSSLKSKASETVLCMGTGRAEQLRLVQGRRLPMYKSIVSCFGHSQIPYMEKPEESYR